MCLRHACTRSNTSRFGLWTAADSPAPPSPLAACTLCDRMSLSMALFLSARQAMGPDGKVTKRAVKECCLDERIPDKTR